MIKDIGVKNLYTFTYNVYNATLYGMFVAARVDVKNSIGKVIRIGENVIELEEYMFDEISSSDLVIDSLLEKANGLTILGYNPLDYIKE